MPDPKPDLDELERLLGEEIVAEDGQLFPWQSGTAAVHHAVNALPALLAIAREAEDHRRECNMLIEAAFNADAKATVLEEQQRWIPVGERLPPDDDDVEVFCHYEGNTISEVGLGAHYPEEGNWYVWGTDYEDYTVTHWRPLPKPPEAP
jgi:hypothetical protein